MPRSERDAKASSSGRKILVTVTSGADSENALQWTLENVYKAGDVLHFLHVVPRQQAASSYGAPPIDFLPQMKSKPTPDGAQEALAFIKDRLLPMCGDMQPDPVITIAKADVDTDSVGFAVCQRAENLNAVAVVMAGRNRSRTGDFFLGSVTNFCTQHCKKPVLLVR